MLMKEKLENIVGRGTITHCLNLTERTSLSFSCMFGGTSVHDSPHLPATNLSNVQLTSLPTLMSSLSLCSSQIALFKGHTETCHF